MFIIPVAGNFMCRYMLTFYVVFYGVTRSERKTKHRNSFAVMLLLSLLVVTKLMQNMTEHTHTS